MGRSAATIGALLAAFTGVVWGGQFVVGMSALVRIDSFWLTSIRYALASLLLLALLAAVEGVRALSPRGRTAQLLVLGTLGFAGFNLLAYTGLAHARPQSASLIVALSPFSWRWCSGCVITTGARRGSRSLRWSSPSSALHS